MWSVARVLQYPLDKKLKDINYMPYTISFVLRKRMQIDSYAEIPKEKRPPERLIWEGSSKEIDEWFDKVFDRKTTKRPVIDDGLIIDISKVE